MKDHGPFDADQHDMRQALVWGPTRGDGCYVRLEQCSRCGLTSHTIIAPPGPDNHYPLGLTAYVRSGTTVALTNQSGGMTEHDSHSNHIATGALMCERWAPTSAAEAA